MEINKKIMSDATKVYEYHELYKGKFFRYRSKYGGTVENILCDGVSVCEEVSLDRTDTSEDGNGIFRMVRVIVSVISDKGNVYDMNEIEWYE